MNRREFATLLGGAVAWPVTARAQQGRLRRIGALMSQGATDPVAQVRYAAFLQGLQQSGWEVGRNLRVDTRWTGGSDSAQRMRVGGRVSCTSARRYPGDRQCGHSAPPARYALRTDCFRPHTGPGWRGLCQQHVAAGRKRYRLYQF
jgi:hypothetical protein